MKNVPIKFRAWCAELGKFVYMVGSNSFILYDDEIYFSDQYDDHYKIKTENMDQLVGYDADGNEVYEGDKLKFCGNPRSYRYVQAYEEARIKVELDCSDLPLSEYKLTSEDEFYNWQYNIHTDDYE